MKERPVLFNSEMVRWILDGRKTQTRRLKGLKDQTDDWRMISFYPKTDGTQYMYLGNGEDRMLTCPYGKPGDRLWVRETWCTEHHLDNEKPSDLWNAAYIPIWYRATDNMNTPSLIPGKWRPSIFMPRWASRITLEITEVRIERLQEISMQEAIAEGVSTMKGNPEPRILFQLLWDEINAKRGFPWESNPWVWVIKFKKI